MGDIEIRIDSRAPVFIRADADAFGAVFASMCDNEQVAVLRSIAIHMEPHKTQWDFISIELEKPENLDLRRTLREALFPDPAATMKEVMEVLGDLEEYFDNRSDVVDGDDGQPEPNAEMRHMTAVRALLAKLEGK